MTQIRTFIVEDSLANREALKKLLEYHCPQVELIGEAPDQERAYHLIKELNPGLVFLDIHMKEGTTFDLLEKLFQEGAINFEIIFATAYGKYEYATRAIEFSALDFITKPIDPKKLKSAVQKAEKRIDVQQYNSQISLLLENLSKPNIQNKRIAFHLPKGIVEFVEIKDVMWLEADGQVTKVKFKNGKQITAMRNLGHYSKLLLAEHDFFPISNKKILNLSYVKRYNHGELAVTLIDDTHLYASRRGGQDFKRYLNDNKREFGNMEENVLQGFLRKIFRMK